MEKVKLRQRNKNERKERKPRVVPFHERGSSRLVEVVKSFSDGVKLTKVIYLWPCITCFTPSEVDFKTFNLLETRMLLGIKCPSCLNPPPESGIVRYAA